MTGQPTQIVVAQKFVNLTGKVGDNLSEAILNTVINTQKELEKSNMKNTTVIVRQVIVTGTLEIKATIIMDIMRVVIMFPQDIVQNEVM